MDAESGADRSPGRVVPVYALTAGRTHSRGPDLPLETLVAAVAAPGGERAPGEPGRVGIDEACLAILRVATAPVSILEIATLLQVPVGVVRVLVGDLAAAGRLAVHPPSDGATPADAATGAGPTAPVGGGRGRAGRPDRELLVALLEGLRVRAR